MSTTEHDFLRGIPARWRIRHITKTKVEEEGRERERESTFASGGDGEEGTGFPSQNLDFHLSQSIQREVKKQQLLVGGGSEHES